MKRCPKCGSNSSVCDSREKGNMIMRRRDCTKLGCRTNWTTYEVDSSYLKQIEDLHNKIKQLKEFMTSI